MNSVNIIGRLTADPEIKYTGAGKAVCNLNLAMDDGWGDQKKTIFIGVTVWGPTAESVGKHCVKGQKIAVDGRLSQDEYEKDGQKIRKTHVTASQVDFLEKPQGQGGQQQQAPPQGRGGSAGIPADQHDEEDDIPF